MSPGPGDKAPDFSGIDQNGETVSLADFRGRPLVLYFYPKDDTPGCTRQACSLRDHNAEILNRGAAVVGVSTQDNASHRRFADKYGLHFPLLADPDKVICRAYGTLASAGGLKGMALQLLGLSRRVTFIIDPAGRIARVIEDPRCGDHGEEVLRLLVSSSA